MPAMQGMAEELGTGAAPKKNTVGKNQGRNPAVEPTFLTMRNRPHVIS
jgi:hypothetical protein